MVLLPRSMDAVRKTRSEGQRSCLRAASSPASVTRRASLPAMAMQRRTNQVELATLPPKQELKCSWLDCVDVFSDLTVDKKREVVSALRQTTHVQGDNIIQQGDCGDRFYILMQGEVSIIKNGQEVNRLIGTNDLPQFFGERALLSRGVREASVRVTSARATTFSMDKTMFDELLQPSFVDRRAAGAVARRLLEDARDRHVERESYQARHTASEEAAPDMLPVIRVEVFSDVMAAVKRSRHTRLAIKTLKDEAAALRAEKASSEEKERRVGLVQKLRATARWAGKTCALDSHVAPDDAWRELRESLVTVSASLDPTSFKPSPPPVDAGAKRPRKRRSSLRDSRVGRSISIPAGTRPN